MLNLFKKESVPEVNPEINILPISKIKTAVVFLDTMDASWAEVRKVLLSFFLQNKIMADFYYIDTNVYKRGTGPMTNPEQTLYGEDFNIAEKVRTDKVVNLFSKTPDIIISLFNRECPGAESIIGNCRSGYKVGRMPYKSNIYSLLVSDPEGRPYSQLEAWDIIKQYMKAIV